MFRKDKFSGFALFVLAVAAIGGLLFGYHTAVISGALTSLTKTFNLNTWDQGLAVSMVLLGGLVGSLGAGKCADSLGRKKILLLTAVIYCLSSLVLAAASTFSLFLFGRFVSGIAVGFSSIVTPIYLGEIAPPHYRGRFVSLFQLALSLGILISYTINLIWATSGWRLVFLVSLIPAVFQLIGLFFVPETPAWLHSHHNKKNAKTTLKELRADPEWKESIHEMNEVEELEKKERRLSLWRPPYRKVLLIGLFLSIFQQITGINTVIYYAPKLFNPTGASTHALLATLAVGVVNFVATAIAVSLLDQLGRRLFLLIGTAGMFVCQLLLGLSYLVNTPAMHLVGLISAMGYVAFFAIGLGPITWVILAEIFPLKIRGVAMGIALFANWLFNYLIALTFLLLIAKLGTANTFFFYGIITLIAWLFTYRFIFETKGKSLEEIEAQLLKR